MSNDRKPETTSGKREDIRIKDAERLQDAIGLVKEELIAEAQGAMMETEAQGAMNEAGWTPVALGSAKEKEIREKKERGAFLGRLRGIGVVAACLVIASVFIVPQIMPGFLTFNTSEEKIESEVTESGATDSGSEAPGYMSESAATDSSASDGSASHYDSSADSHEAKTDGEGDLETPTMDEDMIIEEPPFYQDQAQAFRLTAAEWNDNANWPFFTNLVNSQLIEFPVFGLNPQNRIKVTVTENGVPVAGQRVELIARRAQSTWTTETNKDGVCYLFYEDPSDLLYIYSGGQEIPFEVVEYEIGGQGNSGSQDEIDGQGNSGGQDEIDGQGNSGTIIKDVEIDVVSDAVSKKRTQVMFIVDTTGSMGDELAYLQKDFAAIAEDAYDQNIEYSVNFYRDYDDDYVTKTNGFTKNLGLVQSQLNAEFAAGGGDHPEAVADILMETIVENQDWDIEANKVAFLIFDAPPHEGTDAQVKAAIMSAAEKGIHLVPVVASNADRTTELFGRALAIMTDGTYVFLTDDSGIGNPHLEPIVGDYEVELLHDVIVRIINDYKA